MTYFMRLCASALTLACSAAAQTAEPYAWDAAAHPPQTARLQVWRGDTVPLAPRWGAPTNGWTFTAYWSTNSAGWWSKSLSADPAPSLAGDPFLWSPDMDCGARSYRLFIRASNTGGASYRANAEIAMLDSPGASPAALPPPSAWPSLAADLAPLVAPLVEIVETDPLAGPRLALVEAETNKWRAAYGWGNHALAGYLTSFSESDPLFAAWAGSNTYVRAETDPLAGPRLDLVEAETNKWRTSFGWGNHALAGYLTSFSESDPLFAAWASTNRVTRWQDAADPDIWWVASGGTNIQAWSLSDSQFYYAAEQLGGSILSTTGSFPYSVEGLEAGWFDGSLACISINGAGTWWALDASFPQALVNDSYPPSTAFVYRAAVMLASYNLTTGNVWQAVAEARQSAGQAADQIAGHTSDAAPHPGLFASAEITNAPAWLVYTNIASAVTVTNDNERPVRIYGASATATGTVSFAALREPLPLFFEVSNFAALSFSNAYVVGGGAWQTNMVNLFIAFQSGGETFVTPITAREP